MNRSKPSCGIWFYLSHAYALVVFKKSQQNSSWQALRHWDRKEGVTESRTVVGKLQCASEPPGGLLKYRQPSLWPVLLILWDGARHNLKICISSKFLGDAVVIGPRATLRTTRVEQGPFPIWQVTQTNPGPHLETALSTLWKPSRQKRMYHRGREFILPEEARKDLYSRCFSN